MNIKLSIIQCRCLKDVQLIGKQDPYVTIEYDKTKFRTKTVNDGHTACAWNEDFSFGIRNDGKEIILKVYDENNIVDNYIGKVKIPVSRIFNAAGEIQEWGQLTASKSVFSSTRENTGELLYSIINKDKINQPPPSIPDPAPAPVPMPEPAPIPPYPYPPQPEPMPMPLPVPIPPPIQPLPIQPPLYYPLEPYHSDIGINLLPGFKYCGKCNGRGYKYKDNMYKPCSKCESRGYKKIKDKE